MDEDGFLNPDDDDLEGIDFGDEEEQPPEPEPKPEPAAPPADDHVVHVYEYGKLKRTIDRRFSAEEAEAFASEYNRTAKQYGRFAMAGKEKGRPKKSIEWLGVQKASR